MRGHECVRVYVPCAGNIREALGTLVTVSSAPRYQVRGIPRSRLEVVLPRPLPPDEPCILSVRRLSPTRHVMIASRLVDATDDTAALIEGCLVRMARTFSVQRLNGQVLWAETLLAPT
jgi:hypothetical protein